MAANLQIGGSTLDKISKLCYNYIRLIAFVDTKTKNIRKREQSSSWERTAVCLLPINCGEMKPNLNQNLNRLMQPKFAVILVAIIAVGATAFVLHKKDKPEAAKFEVPKAFASELPGWWLKDNFGASTCSQDICKTDADPDGDKLTNAQEFYYHSDPNKKDTNNNGLNDGEDVAAGFDPSKPGKVTFEEAASDDSVVGESLVFDKDIKQMFAEDISPDKVRVPEPDANLIKISNDDSKQAVASYVKSSISIINKNFPDGYDLQNFAGTQNNSMKAIAELSNLSVPQTALQMQKYLLSFFQILPSVAQMPSQAELGDKNNVEANTWYDNAQIFLVLMQKIQLEQHKLNTL